jgi:CheY-like chemotaxis protein
MSDEAVDILMVEDNPNDAELALYAFRKNKLANRIQVVSDGVEALDFLASCAPGKFPRLILLDLKLPRVDGLEALRQIKAEPEMRKLPVVVLTSSFQERDIEECYNLGVNSYLVKPIDFDKFLELAGILGMYWLLFNQPPLR